VASANSDPSIPVANSPNAAPSQERCLDIACRNGRAPENDLLKF
jgi:hypothetical protein